MVARVATPLAVCDVNASNAVAVVDGEGLFDGCAVIFWAFSFACLSLA